MNHYVYLRDYSTTEAQDLDVLMQTSIDELPYTLASPIEQLAMHIKSNNYGRAMNCALDFFEISTQYLSCYLFVKLQAAEKQGLVDKTSLIRFTNKIDLKRPLSFGDWVNDLFTPLVQLAHQTIPDDKLIKSLSTHIITKKTNLLLGSKKEPSIVQIRNEYRGHSTTLSEDIYKGVVYTLEARILTMLKAIQPLQDLFYFSCETATAGKSRLLLHKGTTSNKSIDTAVEFQTSHYYIASDNTYTDAVDLFPLLFCNNEGYVYVFQSLKDEQISYLSSNLDAITFVSDCWNEPFDKLMQQTSPSFDIAKDLNMAQLKELMDKASMTFLSGVYKERKYNRELFVDRKYLSALLSEFGQSSKPMFPLLGEAGQGKTNQLCYWAEEFIKDQNGVLIFSSSDFISTSLEDRIKAIFNVSPRKDIRRVIDNIHERAVESDCYIYIFFDAINECLTYNGNIEVAGPVGLYNAFRDLFISQHYTQFKLLFTCRSYTWRNLFQQHIVADHEYIFETDSEDNISVRGFTSQELSKAYSIYGELYQMKTPFEQLTPTSTIRLKDPLVLKIACTNYLGQEFPEHVLSYTSIKLFQDMLLNISGSYAGSRQQEIIFGIASYMLHEYEQGKMADRISENILKEAYHNAASPLHHLAKLIYKEDGITIAYGELLNKPERPILRSIEATDDKKGAEIQFIYERFLEYVMAWEFVKRERAKLTAQNENIGPSVYVERVKQESNSVVFMGAMRNALIIDYLHTHSFETLISLIRNYSDCYEVTLLVNEVINVFIRENYEDDLFSLITQLLSEQIPHGDKLIEEFNSITKKIESNQADDQIIVRHKELYAQLSPIIRLRKLASLSVINGIFLTDYFNDNLYSQDPYKLLWALITDPIEEIGNDSCLYAYYLSNKSRTLEFTPLNENLSERIVHEMYRVIKSDSILKCAYDKVKRKQVVVFLETATRIATLLIIDALMQGTPQSRQQVTDLLKEIQGIFGYITFKFRLIKVAMPFLQLLLRKQITFQSIYVNNAIEYQSYWDNEVVPPQTGEIIWCRENMNRLTKSVMHELENVQNDEQMQQFVRENVLSAYHIGDSFSYFVLERLLVMMGVHSWNSIKPIVENYFTNEYRQNEWFDYSQMSMLYILYQTAVNAKVYNEELLQIYAQECEDWTLRLRGLFKARNSHKANTTGLYKRNVMNWYCVIYCNHTGDGMVHDGDERCVPIFYKLIDRAIAHKDKELLFHLIENISELISDNGFIQTGLNLLLYIMTHYDSDAKVKELDAITVDRDGIYQLSLIQLIGNVLGTAKNYFPTQVDGFIKRDIVGLSFPGVPKYKEDILDYTPSGETLSDLFTHKFGNFLMWALINEEAVKSFASQSIEESSTSANCFEWYDKVVRLLFRQMFGVKL